MNLQHNSILKQFSLNVLHIFNFIISECTKPNMNVLFHPPPHVLNESSSLSILSLDISVQVVLPPTCLSACSGGTALVFIILCQIHCFLESMFFPCLFYLLFGANTSSANFLRKVAGAVKFLKPGMPENIISSFSYLIYIHCVYNSS